MGFLSRPLFVFFALFGYSLAGDYCPQIQVIDEIELAKLVGVWWVWESEGMITYTEPHSCHVSHFYPKDANTISVLNDYVYSWGDKQTHVRYSWSITDEDTAAGGNLMATMTLNRMGVKKVPFLVLDTDYTSYMVVVMCKEGANFLTNMKSSLTFLRKLTYTEDELKAINEKVEAALKKSGQTRESLGLVHQDSYTKNCVEPKFPLAVHSGQETVVDAEALTATLNGLATHAGHAVDEAQALAKEAENPAADLPKLAVHLKEHAEDVKAIASDVKDLSSLN